MATISDRVTGKTPFADVIGKRAVCTSKLDATDTDLTSIGAGDIILLAPLLQGQIIERVQVIIDTLEDSTATVDVGIVTWAGGTASAVDVDADGFINDADITAAANTVYATLEANSLDQGYLVPGSTSYLALTANNALNTAKLRVVYHCYLPEPQN
jgi:hypothetical protein